MIRKINWGIISAASIARRRFMPAMLKSEVAQVVVIGASSTDKAEVFASEFNIPKHYGSYQEVLNDSEVDAVYIALPNQWHADWTIKAADAGKHVLCEKPFALDADEALRMAEYCSNKGVILMEAFMYRFNPRTLMMKEIVDSGLIGEPKVITADFSFALEPRHASRLIPGKGSGSLMDVGCYCVNVSRYIFASEPAAVYANSNYHSEIGCDMATSAIMEFSSNRTAMFNSSFETGFRNLLTVAGSEGVLKMDKFVNPGEEGKTGFCVDTRDGKHHQFEFPALDQFLLEIDHFSECIRNEKQPMLDPHADAVANMRVIDALRKSALSRERVQL